MKSTITIIIIFVLIASQFVHAQLDKLEGYWVSFNEEDTITLEIKSFVSDNSDHIGILKWSTDGAHEILYILKRNDTLRHIDPYGNFVEESCDYLISEDSFQIELISTSIFDRVSKREYRKVTKLLWNISKAVRNNNSNSFNQKDN